MKLAEITTKWQGCEKCELYKTRGEDKVCIGKGSANPELLVVIPKPIFNTPDAPTPYEPGSAEHEMFKQITDKLKIDRQKIFMTTSVGCQPAKGDHISPKHTIACRPRIKDICLALNPKAVMLLGPESMFSWTGTNVAEKKMGLVEEDSQRKVIWTWDFSRYITLKSNNQEQASKMAKELFQHWKQISELL